MSKKKLVKVVADVLTPVNRIDMSYKDVTARVPELTEAARRVQAGRMTQSEYAALVNALKPVKPYEFIPKPATVDEAIAALTSNKRGAYGKTADIGAGEMTDLRLDIPAYSQHGVWVNSIHRKGAPTVYGATSSVTDATMIPSPEKAMKVATGETSKAPFAVIRGGWNPMDEAFVVEQAQKYLKHKDWRQVGYDPERHGYFYDRETMSPIVSADEVIQIGPLVLAKKPKYGDPEDFPFRKGGAVNKKIDEIIAQAKQGPVGGYAPLRTRTPSQYEKDFDQYLAAQQEARQRLLTDRIPKSIDDAIAKAAGLVEGGAGALFGYGAQLPGMVGDLRELYEEYKPEGWADAPEWLKRTLTTEQIQDLLTQNLIPPEIATENFKAGTTGGNIAAIAEGVASLPQAAKVIGAGVGKGVRALAPTANQMLENYMLKTGQILPISLDAMRLAVDRKAKGGVMGAADVVGKGIKLGKEMKAAAAAREGVPDLPPAMKEGVLGGESKADKAINNLQKKAAFKALKGQDKQRAIDSVIAKTEKTGVPRTSKALRVATGDERDISNSLLNTAGYKIANVVPRSHIDEALAARSGFRSEPPTTPGASASEADWKKWGKQYGVNMTVTKPESLGISDLTSGREVKIPGGLSGTFSIPDLFWIKANNINPASLPQDVHTELMKKFIRTYDKDSDNVDLFNKLNFALLSPNAPLLPNEFLMQRLRIRSKDELEDLASRAGEIGLGRGLTRASGTGSAGSGGLGILGTANLGSQADLAKLIIDKPEMFLPAAGETLRDVTLRVMNQAPGLGSKTASLGTPWIDLNRANTSAIDLHMINDAYPRLLRDPVVGEAFRSRMANILGTRPDAESILAMPSSAVRDAAISIVGGSSPRKYRLASGELNQIPGVAAPEKLAYEPREFVEFNPFYSRVVDYVDESRGLTPSIELFPEQWRKWDVIRGRIEPHEIMHPDYRKLPKQSFSEMMDALTEHKRIGYSAKRDDPKMDLSDWRKLYYGRAVPEILAPTAAAGAVGAAAISDEKRFGGAVKKKASGGLTSDDLVISERKL